MIRPLPLGLAVIGLMMAGAAHAQTQSSRQARPSAAPFTVRGFGDVGMTRFSAAKSFKAILGTSSGLQLGGGVDVDFRNGAFVGVRASRFSHDGHRVFIFQGTVFDLDVPATISVTPIQVDAGYRFHHWWGVVPYAGGGIGWHRYQETSKFASSGENVATTERGYHLMGGAEVPMTRLLSTAVEGQWTTVPHALGSDPNSISAAFSEHDLGGRAIRVKIIVEF